MKNKLVMWILVMCLLIGSVSAAGVCTLDQTEYSPGETGLFVCECSSPNEQARSGFIVWKNSTGAVLQSVATNSGSCRTSIFSSSYLFLPGQNFLGNATFSLNADGSGIPIDWDDIDDIISDEFNVSGASTVDCLIKDIEGGMITLGVVSTIKITVVDAISGNPLVHANCQAEGYDVGEVPLMFEPYGIGDTSRVSGSLGEVGFQHLMNEKFWKKDTTYLYEFHCDCIPNSTTSEECWDEVTGMPVGFKTCTVQTPFTIGSHDLRDVNYDNLIGIIIGLFVIILFFAFLGVMISGTGIKLFFFGISLIETLMIAAMIYLKQNSLSLVPLLRINVTSLLLITLPIAIYSLWKLMIKLMTPGEGGDVEEVKWQNK